MACRPGSVLAAGRVGAPPGPEPACPSRGAGPAALQPLVPASLASLSRAPTVPPDGASAVPGQASFPSPQFQDEMGFSNMEEDGPEDEGRAAEPRPTFNTPQALR